MQLASVLVLSVNIKELKEVRESVVISRGNAVPIVKAMERTHGNAAV